MPKINKTKYAILGVLNLKPCSGYDIKKFCDASITHFWNENYGHIYPVLKQLESDGWVTKNIETTEGKPPRNVYSITENGKNELVQWLMQEPEMPQHRYEFLLKMFFSNEIPFEKVIERLQNSEEYCKGILDVYREIQEKMMKHADESGIESRFPYQYATLRYGILNVEASLKWCTETIEYLQEFKNKKGRS